MPLVNVVKKCSEKGLSRIKVRLCRLREKLIAFLFHSLFSIYPVWLPCAFPVSFFLVFFFI